MNPVIHFEIPAEDRKRMVDFYSRVFGWRAQMLGPEMGNYVIVTTTEVDENGRPKKPGTINGGFFQKSNDMPDQFSFGRDCGGRHQGTHEESEGSRR